MNTRVVRVKQRYDAEMRDEPYFTDSRAQTILFKYKQDVPILLDEIQRCHKMLGNTSRALGFAVKRLDEVVEGEEA